MPTEDGNRVLFTDRVSSIQVMKFAFDEGISVNIRYRYKEPSDYENVTRSSYTRVMKLCQDHYWRNRVIFQPAYTNIGWTAYIYQEDVFK